MNVFKCGYCGQNKDIKELAGELKKSYTNLLAKKDKLEKDLVSYSSLQISTTDKERKIELERLNNQALKELEIISIQIKNSKDNVCRSCWSKFSKVKVDSFICATCKQYITGKKTGCHVENYSNEGISKRDWVYVCQSCLNTRIIKANIYCPRVSDGRDDDWDVDKPLFDCNCPISSNKQIK